MALDDQIHDLADRLADEFNAVRGEKVDGLNGATGIWIGTEAELPAEPRDPTVVYFVI